jgi:hypothetical protein
MKPTIAVLLALSLALASAGCATVADARQDLAGATATAGAILALVPVDVPVMQTARELHVSSTGNSISYRVAADFEEVIRFYQEECLALGWEQLGGEQIMIESITMQRTKPDRNMSILISTVQGTGDVLVNVMIASR